MNYHALKRRGFYHFVENYEPSIYAFPNSPLFPNTDELQCMTYAFLLVGGNQMNVEFEEDTNKQLWFHIDRTKAKKIKDL